MVVSRQGFLVAHGLHSTCPLGFVRKSTFGKKPDFSIPVFVRIFALFGSRVCVLETEVVTDGTFKKHSSSLVAKFPSRNFATVSGDLVKNTEWLEEFSCIPDGRPYRCVSLERYFERRSMLEKKY